MSDNDQCRAAKLIASDPVVAISGKGGCGKTYVVSKVLQAASANRSKNEYKAKDEEKFKCTEFDDDLTQRPADASDIEESEERCPEEVNVLLTAPTGKAANLLGKRANLTSCTLHQVIWSYRMLKPGVDWKHKDVNVLVVDECSLVSVSTMAFLLELLLKNSKLRRVVLLGDIRQLPSIEPGNFLKDTFQSLEVLGFSVELRTNHRSESQAIVDNATRISNKMFPIFDREKFIYRKLPDNNPESSGNDYMLQDINDDISKLLSHEALKCHVNSQFISFTRRVCEAVNDLCCKHYSNHRIKEHHKYLFRIGDKICCTKNGYVNLYGEKHGLMSCAKVANEGDKETAGGVDRTILTGTSNDTMMDGDTTINEEQTENQSKPSKQIRLCNGEIFFIMNEVERGTDQGRTTTFFELSEDASEDNTFWVEKRQMRKACKIRHAWARTIHTFQGSETDNVVYIVGTRSWRQNWQHVYTAVTRGRKSVFIIGQDYVLRAAIKRSEIRRQTGLKKQLLLAFQKDKKLSPTHEVNSSILCPIVGQGQNSLTKTAQWLADNPKMSFNIHSQPLISKALMKTQADLNSTQDILSSLASEHDQQAEEDDTCPPDDISDRDSPSLLDSPNKEPLSVIKSNKTFYDAKKVLPSSSKTLKSSPRSSITNDETKTKDMIEEYNSDDEGILNCLKGEGVREAVIEEDNSDGESVKSESLLSTPAFGDGLTKIKPHTPVTKSGSCSSSLFSKSLNFNKPVDDGVSPIMLFASKRELNDCYIRTGLSPLTPNDSSIDRKQGFNSSTTSRQSPFTPLSGTHKINQIEQKTSSPLASFSVSSSVQVSSPNSVIEYPDIKEPPSNESMWSEIDESCYLDITDSQIGVDKTCLSDIGINSSHSEFSRNGSLAHQKWAGGNKQGIKLTEGASPSTFSINGCRDRFLNKTPNVNNQSSCSQWSEVDDDQYITALDLVDIENMATQVDDIEEIDRGSQSQQFNEYRQPQATPPNVDDCGKILNTTSEPSCVHGSPGIKRQLSMERTEVSPMKRRLATLKFE